MGEAFVWVRTKKGMGSVGEDCRWAIDNGGNGIGVMDVPLSRDNAMIHNPPYRLFGYELAACHGIPAIVMILSSIILSAVIIECASQYVKPVTLDSIWVEPRTVSAASIMAQTEDKGAVQLHKSGMWSRLCNVTAKQTFIDERGGTLMQGEYHSVDTPPHSGRFANKFRDLQIPKLLAHQPGVWRIKIENVGICNWFEKFMPITGMTAEATFEIIP